jgi:tetratricopeptide (TPR) repeat protein
VSLYFDNGHFQKAVEQYEASLQINPNSFEVYLVSGLAYLKLQQSDKVIKMFQNILRLQSNN